MKDDILDQIDKLKMMVIMDDCKLPDSEEVKYKEWVDELMGRSVCSKPHKIIDNKKYAEYKTILYMVADLYRELNYSYGYCKDEPEIKRMVNDVVAMTIFYKERMKRTK